MRVRAVFRVDLGVAGLAICMVGVTTGGCTGEPSGRLFRSGSTTQPRQVLLTHDLGDIVQGAAMVHAFVFENPTAQVLEFDADRGVQKSCRCASVRLSVFRLPPGDRCSVEVKVDTEHVEGRFSEPVSLPWRLPNGNTLHAVCVLNAKISPLLSASPRTLVFSREDVSRRVVKEIAVTSAFPVDWESLSPRVTPPFELREIERVPSGRVLRVHCEPGQRGDAVFDGTLTLYAEATVDRQTLRGAHAIHLMADHSPALIAVPRSVVLVLDRHAEGVVRFRLRGERLRSGIPALSVSVPGFQILEQRCEALSPDEQNVQVRLRRLLVNIDALSHVLRIDVGCDDTLEIDMLIAGGI